MNNGQFCFLSDEYYEKFPNHGLMENRVAQDIIANSKIVLAKVMKGAKLVFTNVVDIKKALLDELNVEKNT